MSASPLELAPLTALVEDIPSVRDGRPSQVARSSACAGELLVRLRGQRVDELWLDHDLAGDDTVRPVARLLENAHSAGKPCDIVVHVHASRQGAAHEVLVSLRRAGYTAIRSNSRRCGRGDRRPAARGRGRGGSKPGD